MRAIAPSALVLTKKYPSFGSTEPLPQLPPPSPPGNTIVGFIPTGVNGPLLCAPPSASNSASQNFCCSGVTLAISSRVIPRRVTGGGLTGNGSVGEYHSPGTSPLGTGRSSTG